MRAYICTLVALDTVFFNPFGHECCHTAFFVCRSAVIPRTVGAVGKVGNLQEVAVLCVDGAHDFVDELGVIVRRGRFDGEVAPCGVDFELVVFATTVDGRIVLVDDILTFFAIALDDEFLHLFYGKVYGDYLGDAEECALENGVGAVAKADFLCNLGRVDVVDGDVVVGEIFLDLRGEVLGEFLAFPDGVEQEGAVVAQTACHIIHVEVCLHVACHEVGGVHQVGGTDGCIAETEV